MTDPTTVTIAAVNADSTPAAFAQVIARLIHGGAGGTINDVAIVDEVAVRLDEDGEGTVALYPNDAIVPAGTYWSLTVKGSTPTVVRLLDVPESATPVSWTDPAYLLEDPSPPTVLPAPTSGVAFQVPRVNSTGDTYELRTLVPADISGLQSDLSAAFGGVYTAIGAEATTRGSADDAEVAAREAADTALDGDITAEASARAAGDTATAVKAIEALRAESVERLSTAPRFQVCGPYDEVVHAGYEYQTTALPDFTTGAYYRFTVTALPVDNGTDTPVDAELSYSEIATQTHDSGGGSWDNFEIAVERIWDDAAQTWRPHLFYEWTEIDGTAEAYNRSTRAIANTAGVNYPAWEMPVGVPVELVVWLDFANGDGDWDLSFWRRVYHETPDATFDDAEWVRITRSIGDGPTSVDTGVTEPAAFGYGKPRIELFDLTIRDGGPTGTILADPTAALAYAEGTGQPFDDAAGNTWTPGVSAAVSVPSSGGGGVSLGETSTTAYRGDRGKTAYDHSQVVTGNPHGTTAADVGAAATSHTHAAADLPAYPYPDRAHIIFAIDEPSTTVGTWAPATGVNGAITGSYAVTGTTVGDTSWTYDNIQLVAGTYKPELIYRGSTAAGIATLAINGTSGTVDTYRASTANDQRATPAGTFTVATSGPVTVTISNPTKGSGSAYGLSLQSFTLRRTGA